MLNYEDDAFQEWLRNANPKPANPTDATAPWHQQPDGHYFPFPEARPGQLETVEQIRAKTEAGYRVLVNGGTGFGKSPTMLALAATFHSAWILVGKNDLVEQYRKDFEHLQHVGFLKSKTQFRCSVVPGQSCYDADAECKRIRKQALNFLKGESDSVHPSLINPARIASMSLSDARREVSAELKNRPCPYTQNRDFALVQNYTIMTVQMALTIFTYLKYFPPVRTRSLLIVDECSELEGELMSFFETTVSTKRVFDALFKHDIFRPDSEDYIPRPNDLAEALEWLDAVAEAVGPVSEQLEKNPDTFDAKRAGAVRSLEKNIQAVKQGVKLGLPYHFEIEETGFYGPAVKGHDSYRVTVKPLECRGLYDRVFGEMAHRHVFCSATTGTPDVWQATHQMKFAVDYLEVGSPFPKENRPIIFKPMGSMARNYIDASLPLMCQEVIKLCEQNDQTDDRLNHKNQKGLIHTYTSRIANAMVEAFHNAGHGRRVRILQGSGAQRAEIMQMFKDSDKPLILISPSAMLGISLDDDNGRFQVICKTPYPFLGDEGVKYRQNHIKDWYSWQTSKDIIQACGRVVRSAEDWGITYIVDSAFANHLRWNANQFPHWWHEAYQKDQPAAPAAQLPALPPIAR